MTDTHLGQHEGSSDSSKTRRNDTYFRIGGMLLGKDPTHRDMNFGLGTTKYQHCDRNF